MRALFTTYEGGGHVPPALIVGRRLQEDGHHVRLVSDEATRDTAAGEGLEFRAWRRAPNRTVAASASDPLEDWKARTPIGVVRAVCDAVMCRPALDYARDTLETLEAFPADVVVTQELLFGAMAAAEAARVKLALLTGNLWCFPTREDVPPFGPGFLPARNRFEAGREQTARALLKRLYDVGLSDLNRARDALGLRRLRHVLDQLERADLVLLGASSAFDYGRAEPPSPFRYAGPLFNVPAWSAGSAPLKLADEGPPLVLVSFSTTFQNQAAVVSRCIEALASLPVRGVVTLGPALEPADVAMAPNVTVVKSASHDELVPRCAAIICHGGHGTLLRPLMHGVPVLCLPMGRDQPENAARLVHAGAGLRLPASAGSQTIRRSLHRLLTEPGFREAAQRLGRSITLEADGGRGAAAAIVGLATA